MERKWIAIHLYEMMKHFKSRVQWQITASVTLDSMYKLDHISDEDYEFFDDLIKNRRFHDKYVELAGNDAGQIVIFEA